MTQHIAERDQWAIIETRRGWQLLDLPEGVHLATPHPYTLYDNLDDAKSAMRAHDPDWRYDPIDINNADSATLQTLSGVGASLADAIIAGRPWADVSDLSSISGISADRVAVWMDDPGLVAGVDHG